MYYSPFKSPHFFINNSDLHKLADFPSIIMLFLYNIQDGSRI